MHVAQLIETDGPGGAEQVVVRLASGLVRRGHRSVVAVLSGRDGWVRDRLSGVAAPVHTLQLARPIDPAFVWRLARWVRASGADVVHAHEFTMAVYGTLAARLAGRPVVVTMHGGAGFERRVRRRLALRLAARLAHRMIGVSRATSDRLTAALGIDAGRIVTVPNGVPEPAGSRERARRQLGLDAHHQLVLAVGNLYPVKDHATLVAAAALLDRGRAWTIAIAGRGDERQAIDAAIQRHQLGDRVRLLGLRDDVQELLAATDIWVSSSRSEGMPLSMLEAMRAGRPIVATAVGGVPEAITNEVTGLLVPPEDPQALAWAMQRLLDDRRLAEALGKAARSVAADRFSDERMLDAHLALYASALEAAR